MAQTLTAEDIAAILAAINGSTILAKEATLLSKVRAGVLVPLTSVVESTDMEVYRGDVQTTTFTFSSAWSLTGKVVKFMVKADRNSAITTANDNKSMTVLTATTASLSLTAAETATAGTYYYDVVVYDTDGTSNPMTAFAGKFIIKEGVRK
jgi:hypothetical protein